MVFISFFSLLTPAAGVGITACNVTGDGALTLFLTGYAEKHGI